MYIAFCGILSLSFLSMSADKAGAAVHRAMVIGKAVRQLRNTLGLSQKKLADLLGTDGMNVSKWETARTAPNEWRSRELAAMAKKAGRSDIAGVFVLPPEAWHLPMRDKLLERTLIILQIGAATLRKAEAENYPFGSDELFMGILRDAASSIKVYLLKRWDRKGLAPELSDCGQFDLWLDELAEFRMMDKFHRDQGDPGYLETKQDEWIFGPRENVSEKAKNGEKAEKTSGRAAHKKNQRRR
jgi:DNA-binding transcriptional regulator YiaG